MTGYRGGGRVRPVPNWTEAETTWLAGLLEGEGSFTSARVNGLTSPPTIRIDVAMTDKDVIERAAALLGAASVLSKPVQATEQGNPRKPQWLARITGHMAAEAMTRLLPHMGARRATRIEELLAAWAADRQKKEAAA